MEFSKITIRAVISADRQKVWDCYTLPKHITGWNFADPSWHCPTAANDLKVGGRYLARMEAKDGSFGFDFEAIYNEVVMGKKLVYTMTDNRQAEVLFQDNNDTTEVKVTFDAEKENSMELQKTGGKPFLTTLKIIQKPIKKNHRK